ncbi:pyrroline-5-carboxylate reductase [Iodidimonas nitroreducens]|uniref:Pyrroline-5-carboxylate reductase n=1 Tax=Iodidimonas nitroreducens TaxID=1236968 RepID=A0A5A7N7L7_9PROT|nr:pyrroline-5-carboxylate reductase [Iodidimonas nitroreducens]GAK33206.1 pyrroline-5-carboxylate reductase [alpha proteobacterium Q-1]GER04322.1 pyrroline-5-carboxylate reductase [Iodidimonas nitroreducens]
MDLSQMFQPQKPLLLIGCGRMGTAMARGWLDAGLARDALAIIDPAGVPDVLKGAAHYASVEAIPDEIKPEAIILAVKPYMMADVVAALTPKAAADPLVISVAAGIRLKLMSDVFKSAVRVMPNTPAAIGKGMMVAVAARAVSYEKKELTTALMAAAGAVLWVEDEVLMDAVTGVSGSGPAYIFALTEAMAAAGMANGLSRDVAEKLARQTVIGAAHLMEKTPDMSAAQLREQVTSPGGTTAAALDVLRADDGFGPLLERAVRAAADRSKELAE